MNIINFLKSPESYFGRLNSYFRVRKDRDFWREIKDRHKGKPGWIIGNGPSLNAEDLNKLTNQVSIGSNRIYLIYEKCRWRPTYHTVVDNLVWDKFENEICKHTNHTIIPSRLPSSLFSKVKVFQHLRYNYEKGLGVSLDVSHGAYGGYSVTFENIQLALHLGCKPIYLLGCDHYYQEIKSIDKGPALAHVGAQNHFSPLYRSKGEMVNPANIERMTRRYHDVANFAEQNQIEIYNLTRGGHLEEFPRKNFDAVVEGFQ